MILNRITNILNFVTIAETFWSTLDQDLVLCVFCFAVDVLTIYFLFLPTSCSLTLQAIVYEGQDKNPEMCRVLLTHEIMCRWEWVHLFPLPKSSSCPLCLQSFQLLLFLLHLLLSSPLLSSFLLQHALFVCKKFSAIMLLYSVHFLFCHPH